VRYRWQSPQASDDLQVYVLKPVQAFSETPDLFANLDSVLTDQCQVSIKGTGSIRFDFGVETGAWLEIDSPDLSGSIEMSISEYDEPEIVNSTPKDGGRRFKTSVPRVYGNTYRLELNKALYEGVRFGWLHVRNFDRPWHLTGVRVVCQVKPTNYNGSFSCSDSMLTRIWYTAAHGVKANLCRDYFGAILNDRGDRHSWTGDAHAAQAAALVAFGNWDFIKENIDRTATDNNRIESYALCWVLSLLDYYQHSGDTATLEKYISLVETILQHANSIYDNPRITFYGHDERLGACFEEPNRFETKNAYRMRFARCCIEFAAAMDSIGKKELQDRYKLLATEKVNAFCNGDRWFEPYGLHALAEAVNTGGTTKPEQETIYPLQFANRLDRLSYDPLNQYFVLQALAGMDRHDDAMLSIKDYWGRELDYGATTFFEVFTPSWTECLRKNGPVPNCQVGYTSLAHAWSGGVTAWISHEVLGIKPTAPGFRTIDITPHCGSSLAWVSGSMPTPRGPVTINFDSRKGSFDVTVPRGSVARVGVPIAGRSIKRLSLNGVVLETTGAGSNERITRATRDTDFIYLHDIPSGRHTISIQYKGTTPYFVNRPIVYDMKPAREDATTGGDWGANYGRHGYVLFNYDGDGRNTESLPPYVAAVIPAKGRPYGNCHYVHAASSTNDKRALARDRRHGEERNVGLLCTAPPPACQETMSIDIKLLKKQRYRLSFYFLDWERQNLRQVVEIFDLDTLKRIAPVQAIRDFSGGKYLVYQSDRSIRMRINQLRDETAVLNGLFFDPVS
jgi:hypothetical protein